MSEEIELSEEVIEAIQSGRKIEAIKLLREQQGLGLKDAKHVVDVYVREHPPSSHGLVDGRSRGRPRESHMGRLVFAAIAAVVAYWVFTNFS